MKTMKALPSTQLRACLVVLALAFATAACDGPVGPQGDRGAQGSAGEDGSQGPQGPGGQDGERGPRGPAGQDGEDGEDGNANVIYSDWLSPSWYQGSNNYTRYWPYIDENMTTAFLSTGVVLIYARDAYSNSTVYPLSGLRVGDISFRSAFRNYSPSVNYTLRLDTYTPDPTDYDDLGVFRFRYVLIPGGVPTGGLRAGLQAGPDLNDYDAVKAYYGIPDDGAGVITR